MRTDTTYPHPPLSVDHPPNGSYRRQDIAMIGPRKRASLFGISHSNSFGGNSLHLLVEMYVWCPSPQSLSTMFVLDTDLEGFPAQIARTSAQAMQQQVPPSAHRFYLLLGNRR